MLAVRFSLDDNHISRDTTGKLTTELSIGTTWVRENSAIGTGVKAVEFSAPYLYTSRKTVEFPSCGQDIEDVVSNIVVNYIIVLLLLQGLRATWHV